MYKWCMHHIMTNSQRIWKNIHFMGIEFVGLTLTHSIILIYTYKIDF